MSCAAALKSGDRCANAANNTREHGGTTYHVCGVHKRNTFAPHHSCDPDVIDLNEKSKQAESMAKEAEVIVAQAQEAVKSGRALNDNENARAHQAVDDAAFLRLMSKVAVPAVVSSARRKKTALQLVADGYEESQDGDEVMSAITRLFTPQTNLLLDAAMKTVIVERKPSKFHILMKAVFERMLSNMDKIEIRFDMKNNRVAEVAKSYFYEVFSCAINGNIDGEVFARFTDYRRWTELLNSKIFQDRIAIDQGKSLVSSQSKAAKQCISGRGGSTVPTMSGTSSIQQMMQQMMATNNNTLMRNEEAQSSMN